jgi:hypothetical protein
VPRQAWSRRSQPPRRPRRGGVLWSCTTIHALPHQLFPASCSQHRTRNRITSPTPPHHHPLPPAPRPPPHRLLPAIAQTPRIATARGATRLGSGAGMPSNTNHTSNPHTSYNPGFRAHPPAPRGGPRLRAIVTTREPHADVAHRSATATQCPLDVITDDAAPRMATIRVTLMGTRAHDSRTRGRFGSRARGGAERGGRGPGGGGRGIGWRCSGG